MASVTPPDRQPLCLGPCKDCVSSGNRGRRSALSQLLEERLFIRLTVCYCHHTIYAAAFVLSGLLAFGTRVRRPSFANCLISTAKTSAGFIWKLRNSTMRRSSSGSLSTTKISLIFPARKLVSAIFQKSSGEISSPRNSASFCSVVVAWVVAKKLRRLSALQVATALAAYPSN